MTFLGIDQSLMGTGLSVLSDVGVLVASARIDTDELRDGERLLFIKKAVALHLGPVEFAALEGYSYNSTGHVFELGEIGGVLKTLLVESSVPYVSVPPILLKKFATGTTHADKDKMLGAALAQGHDFGDDDNQADAFFLARIALAYAKNTAKHRCEMEVIHTLRNPKDKKPKRRVRRLIKNAV
jgi:Holliday junction resolvasome RuvABC endonuclease subunit